MYVKDLSNNTLIDKIFNLLVLILISFYGLTWFNYVTYSIATSYSLIVLFGIFCVWFVLSIGKTLTEDRYSFIFIFIALIISLVNFMISQSSLGSILIEINILIFLLIARVSRFSEKNIIKYSSIFFMIYIYIIIFADKRLNTNSIGLLVVNTFIYSNFMFEKNKLFKFIRIVFIIISAIEILNVSSRGALLGLIVFCILKFIVPYRVWVKPFVYKFICISLTYGSIVFVLLYTYMWKNGIKFTVPFTNKPLYTGRELIWNELLNAFLESPMSGLGSNFELTTFSNLNIHNSMFNILVIYGLPVFLIVINIMLYYLFKLRVILEKDVLARNAVIGLFSFFIIGFFETNLLASTTMFVSSFLWAIAFSRYNFIKERDKNLIR